MEYVQLKAKSVRSNVEATPIEIEIFVIDVMMKMGFAKSATVKDFARHVVLDTLYIKVNA